MILYKFMIMALYANINKLGCLHGCREKGSTWITPEVVYVEQRRFKILNGQKL